MRVVTGNIISLVWRESDAMYVWAAKRGPGKSVGTRADCDGVRTEREESLTGTSTGTAGCCDPLVAC